MCIVSLALTLVDIPITFGTSLIFAILLYFLVGLQLSAAQFLWVFPMPDVCSFAEVFFSTFYLFLFTMSVTMKAWFRAIAAAFKSEATAQAVSGASCGPCLQKFFLLIIYLGIVLLALVIYTYVGFRIFQVSLS